MVTDIVIAAQYRIHPDVWGGMDEFIVALQNRLFRRGTSLKVVVPRLTGTDPTHYLKRSIPCEVLDGPLFFNSLHSYCLDHPCRILHTHFMPTLSAKYRRFGKTVSTIISTEHMPRPINGWSFQKKLRTKVSSLVGCHFVSKIVHVSRYLETENIGFFGSSVRSKSYIIHNGVLIRHLNKAYPDNIDSGRKLRLVSAGRLVPEKGFSDLIKVVKKIIDQHGPVVELEILGDGPSRIELENEAGCLIGSSIFFRGFVNDVCDRLRRADLYVHTSFQEAFAFVLLEAGEAGLPSLAYDVGGNPEVITDGYNGALIEPGNIEQMAVRIGNFIENPMELVNQGFNARQRVESDFTVERMVSEYVELYDKYILSI